MGYYVNIRIAIADDHELLRQGIQQLINSIEGFEIVGDASNGEELVRLVKQSQPDVLLIDVKMPKLNGIDTTKIIKREYPHIGIIGLSSFDEDELIMEMIRAGAKGYLLKNTTRKELSEAVLAVYRGETYYCHDINRKLAQVVASGGSPQSGSHGSLFTSRELQVIRLICEEYSSKQIAAQLDLKTRTVERYRDAIMEKMGARNSAGVVKYALQFGLYKSAIETKPGSHL
jgi:DNA-binding NarL/FixJ family response regulator